MSIDKKYSPSLTNYIRRKSRVVSIGNIPVGGVHPIRVQSMTTTDTMNTEATVQQSIRLINAGCEYVRITAPSINEAENLQLIKKQLRGAGFDTPIIADIHFTPNAAETSARIVEKVRINPGNFADSKKFNIVEYSDDEYNYALDRIRKKFSPLVKICKQEGTAMRIGTNHGSLSDRIMSRYGDTPLGMVESALEFIRICEDQNFHDIVLSMKASNPMIMVQAYRLLVNRMDAEDMDYPLHLGVTEAGEGEDGRIKSALGIGTLLEDGLGDTIRVSLTEEPENEIPVAQTIVARYHHRENSESKNQNISFFGNPFEYHRHETIGFQSIGGDNPGVVIVNGSQELLDLDFLNKIGYTYLNKIDKWSISDQAADYLYIGDNSININIPDRLKVITDQSFTEKFGVIKSDTILQKKTLPDRDVFILEIEPGEQYQKTRSALFKLQEFQVNKPVLFSKDFESDGPNKNLFCTTDIGGLFLDGFGDGFWLNDIKKEDLNLAFNIMQAARIRMSKTEYISCPSCGRTLFDLQETTGKIRNKTDHLKGVKIGIMGCIVNGPGEMADADFGYVGTGVGKISLYKGQEVVKKNVPTENAVDELVDLIKLDGKWQNADESKIPV